MEFVKFEQVNTIPKEEKDDFNKLPAYIDPERGITTVCIKPSKEELKQLKETGVLYLTVLTQRQQLQPIGNSLLNPFKED